MCQINVKLIPLLFILCLLNVDCDRICCDRRKSIFNWHHCKFNSVKETDVIEIHSGKIRGHILSNIVNGEVYSSFKGIRYAEPPVGKARYLSPIPVKPWNGIFEAVSHGSVCPQMLTNYITYNKFIGKEDCLFLNVYTPMVKFNFESYHPKKAVMVWIHGGAFVRGSGNSDYTGPDFLVNKGVILVTFNYRLGAPGFLNLQNNQVPGNAGLKDQNLVLRWVKKNIAKFGGDPDNITIFGQSAGAVSVDLHLISNMSRGLFRRSISMSGSSFCSWGFSCNPQEHAKKLAKVLCMRNSSENEFQLTDPFIKMDIVNLTNTTSWFLDRSNLQLPVAPSIELKTSNKSNVFIDESFEKKFERGEFHQGEHIIGFTNKETNFGGRKMEEIFKKVLKTKRKWLIKGFLNKFKKIFTPNSQNDVIDESTEYLFRQPIDLKQKYMIFFGNPKSVYYYVFEYEEENRRIMTGAVHSDDLNYLFSSTNSKHDCIQYNFNQDPTKFSRDVVMRERLVTMFTNFAKYGNPSIINKIDVYNMNVNWRSSNLHGGYLNITKEGTMIMSYDRPLKTNHKINKLNYCELPPPHFNDLYAYIIDKIKKYPFFEISTHKMKKLEYLFNKIIMSYFSVFGWSLEENM